MQKLVTILDGKVTPMPPSGKYFIEKFTIRRSQPMNRLYWKFISVISDETGNDADLLHALFKEKFLPKKTVIVKGKQTEHVMEVTPSTTELDSLAFSNYLDRIASFVGIPIPNIESDPNYISN